MAQPHRALTYLPTMDIKLPRAVAVKGTGFREGSGLYSLRKNSGFGPFGGRRGFQPPHKAFRTTRASAPGLFFHKHIRVFPHPVQPVHEDQWNQRALQPAEKLHFNLELNRTVTRAWLLAMPIKPIKSMLGFGPCKSRHCNNPPNQSFFRNLFSPEQWFLALGVLPQPFHPRKVS